ncbi:hypothetical protein HGRIS_008796 [Hohenbuehelia grisea]|uniref:Uncharacterized protein n=1 Tax=Hohenbuehelia grisea TaxID=104357 RepID=A0ABR3J950_9AGAR
MSTRLFDNLSRLVLPSSTATSNMTTNRNAQPASNIPEDDGIEDIAGIPAEIVRQNLRVPILGAPIASPNEDPDNDTREYPTDEELARAAAAMRVADPENALGAFATLTRPHALIWLKLIGAAIPPDVVRSASMEDIIRRLRYAL